MRGLLYMFILLVALSGCRYDDFGEWYFMPSGKLYPNMDICDVRALYKGSPAVVNNDVILAGYVIANDVSGNFYRTFVIDDGTGAIEIRAGLYNLKNLFPVGRYVAVRASGLTVSDYNSVLQIGLAPEGGSSLPQYFGHELILDRYVYRGDEMKTVSPLSLTADLLSPELCGRLVSLSGLKLKDGEEPIWASQDSYASYSNRVFVDRDANEIAVMTSKYADFAGNDIPAGEITVTGILMMENNKRYILKMRDINDVVED